MIVGTDFIGRTTSYLFKLISRNYSDLVFTDYGPLWKLQRKLGHQSLKTYGEGYGNLEDALTKQCRDLVQRLHATDKKPIDIRMEFGG